MMQTTVTLGQIRHILQLFITNYIFAFASAQYKELTEYALDCTIACQGVFLKENRGGGIVMRHNHHERKRIMCPLCYKGRVIDAAKHTDLSRLKLYAPLHAHKAEWFSKCPKCRQQIGMSFG